MPIAVTMPKLGMSMEEGTVVEWRARPGARVEKGQVVLVIESEKAQSEIEATASGLLRHIYVDEGDTVPCGTPLAALTAGPDEPFDAGAFQRSVAPPPAAPSEPAAPEPGPGRAPARPRAAATPAARRLAERLGVDVSRAPGSGPGGRITREDVEALAASLEARIEVADGVALEISRAGGGAPVLLLPGFGADLSSFARQIPLLAEHYRVAAVNPRGIGLSDAPEADAYGVAVAAADAAAVAGAVCERDGEPVHLVGASLGAAAAVELALERPEAVRSLALITPFLEAPPRLLSVLEAWVALAEAGDPELLARALLPWLFSAEILSDSARSARAVRGLAQAAPRAPAATLRRSLAGLRAWSGTRTDDLARIAAPTLVIAAGQDLLTPGAAGVAAALPRARLRSIDRAGHAVMLETPEELTAALLDHLDGAGRGD